MIAGPLGPQSETHIRERQSIRDGNPHRVVTDHDLDFFFLGT